MATPVRPFRPLSQKSSSELRAALLLSQPFRYTVFYPHVTLILSLWCSIAQSALVLHCFSMWGWGIKRTLFFWWRGYFLGGLIVARGTTINKNVIIMSGSDFPWVSIQTLGVDFPWVPIKNFGSDVPWFSIKTLGSDVPWLSINKLGCELPWVSIEFPGCDFLWDSIENLGFDVPSPWVSTMLIRSFGARIEPQTFFDILEAKLIPKFGSPIRGSNHVIFSFPSLSPKPCYLLGGEIGHFWKTWDEKDFKLQLFIQENVVRMM